MMSLALPGFGTTLSVIDISGSRVSNLDCNACNSKSGVETQLNAVFQDGCCS